MEKITTIKIQFRFPTEKYPNETALVKKALNLLPNDVKKFFVENPPMFSAEIEGFRANAFIFTHEEFKEQKFLIHFQYHIWDYNDEEIIRIILHELAHCYLQHECGYLSYEKSKKHISKIENEADMLAAKWLQNIK